MMIDLQAATYAGVGAALVAIGGAIAGSAFGARARRGLAVATSELESLRDAVEELKAERLTLLERLGAEERRSQALQKQLDERPGG